MRKRILIISSYPAPYRVEVFKGLSEVYDTEIYFDTIQNENRNADWFCKSGECVFEVLNNPESKKHFCNALMHIRKYDLVIAYDPARYPSMMAIAMCIVTRVPYCVNNDGAFITPNKLRDIIKRVMFSNAAACFSSGRASTEYFKYYGVKPERIHQHVFTSLKREDIRTSLMTRREKSDKRRELGMEDRYTVITVGQFIPRKGFDVLLDAWRLIDSAAQLYIIGGGDCREEYEDFIQKYGMTNVKVLDFMPKEKLFEYYLASELFVLPTREDVWGLVINEAMAVGLPVISTERCNAALELIEEDVNGYIVPVGDAKALADKMSLLVGNAEKTEKMAQASLMKIADNIMENIAKRHIEVIDKM